MYKTPISKDAIKAIFPFAAQQGIFEESSCLTMPVSQLRQTNANAKKELDPATANIKKDKKQMDLNNLNILIPREFTGTEDMQENIHPRLFYNAPIMDSGKLFQMLARNKDKKPLATDQYNLNHINGAGCITTKGWFDAHDLESHSVTSKNYCNKNFNKVMSGGRRFVFGKDDQEGSIETEIALDECEEVSEAMECLLMISAARRRANILDYSIEPLQRYLARNTWFMSHPDRPQHVPAGRFCAGFIDFVLKQNAARFHSVQPHLYYNQMDDMLKEFKMNCKFSNTNFEQGSRNIKNLGNKNGNSRNTGKNGKQTSKPCWYYNTQRGCRNKTDCTTGPHVCSVKTSGRLCGQAHPAHLHESKAGAKGEGK